MKRQIITDTENDFIIEILASSRAFQLITVKNRYSNEILADNLLLDATMLHTETPSLLSFSDLEEIQSAVERELVHYKNWETVPSSQNGKIISYRL